MVMGWLYNTYIILKHQSISLIHMVRKLAIILKAREVGFTVRAVQNPRIGGTQSESVKKHSLEKEVGKK